jgi:hypothetical protein
MFAAKRSVPLDLSEQRRTRFKTSFLWLTAIVLVAGTYAKVATAASCSDTFTGCYTTCSDVLRGCYSLCQRRAAQGQFPCAKACNLRQSKCLASGTWEWPTEPISGLVKQ